MARKKKSSTEEVAEAVAEVAEAVAAVAAVVDGPTVAEVAHAIEEIGEAVNAARDAVPEPVPAPAAVPGGFARLRKAKAAAREEKRRELARAALDRKQRDRAQSHFERRAHKEHIAQSAVDRAAAFIQEHAPKTNGRRLSKLDNAKKHNAVERARRRGIDHKLRQMQRLVRFVEANPPAAAQAPAAQAPAAQASEPDTQD